jgi:tetratricopeptide (TPR) repeat protein
MKTIAGIIGIIFLCVLANGCATLGTKPSPKNREQLADEYQTKARDYEAKGELVEALEQYKLWLTVDSENKTAQEKSTQIGQELKKLAENRYQSGLAYYQKGQYAQARQEFLTALRYDPDHQGAKEMLTANRELEQVDRYVLHTIQPDETLATLAKQYYGDYKKFHLIAQYNQIEDAAKVKVGQQIKIPVIEGVPIMADPSEIQTVSGKAPQAKPEEIITVKGFVVHTVKPEETLSKLAKMYYGDLKKYDLIAKFNDMQVSDSLRVGQEIKIPEVEGVPFLAPETKEIKEIKTPEAVPAAKEVVPEKAVEEPETAKVEAPEEDQAAAYRKSGIELYQEKNYADAVVELQKALNANPDDKVAKDYLSLAYFDQGVASFKKEDYPQAIKAFETSRQFNSSCEKCETYLKQSQENFKDLHYRKGVSYFGQEKLAEAISEWKQVYNMDPNYKDVSKNISKAQILLQRLEEIQKSNQKK